MLYVKVFLIFFALKSKGAPIEALHEEAPPPRNLATLLLKSSFMY